MTGAPIEFQCASCGKLLKVAANGAGKTVRCPGCGQSVVVPAPSQPARLPQITQRPEVKTSTYGGSLPASRSYPVLTLIAMMCRAMAVLVVAMAGVGIVVGYKVAAAQPDNSRIGMVAAVIAVGLVAILAALLLIMVAEMIMLAVHIQGNTLAAAHASRRAG